MEKRTHLLWLIDSFGAGGAEALTIPFARQLDRARYELLVVSHASRANLVEEELQKGGVRTQSLGARNLRDVRAFLRFLRLLRTEKIDLIHAHLTYSSTWAALASRITGIPAVASLHVEPSATLALQKGRFRRWLTRTRDRLMRRVVGRWAARTIVVSDALRTVYLAETGLDPQRTVVVHNGVEIGPPPDRLTARQRLVRELGVPPSGALLVAVAVLRPGKGIETLLEALRHLPDRHLLVIGDGEQRASLLSYAESLGVADRVHWSGFRNDVAALLRGCDLLVHPSLADAFPTVLLEGMAAGLPVVASRVGGIPEIVTAETGRLVEPGNPAALAAAIRELLADAGALDRMGRAARAVAEEHFSVEAWIARLEAVYDSARLDHAASRRPRASERTPRNAAAFTKQKK